MIRFVRFTTLIVFCLMAAQKTFSQAEIQNPNTGAGVFWRVVGNANTDTAIHFVGTTDSRPLTFRTNDIRRVTINTDGNVGIGTVTPTRLLHIFGTSNTVRIGGLASGGSFINSPSATTDKIMFADANGDLRAFANGSSGQTLTINGSGVPAWTSAGASTAWALLGNAGTNPSTNFVGTTDAQDLVFRVDNEQAGYLEIGTAGNTLLGHRAGFNTSGGTENTMLGNYAGELALSFYNVMVGNRAGQILTTGQGNTNVGYRTNSSTNSAEYTTTLGYEAGRNNDANNITFVGAEAGRENSAFINNSYFGFKAGRNVDGNNNAAFGDSVLVNTSATSNNNAAFGSKALSQHTNGSDNAVVGYRAAEYMNGFGNAVFGSKAAAGWGTGTNNSVFGFEAGGFFNGNSVNTTSLFGYRAGFAINTANSISAFGAESGNANNTGKFNSYFGYRSGFKNVSGEDNAFFGDSAGVELGRNNNFSESHNSFFGAKAGRDIYFGADNTMLGYNLGRFEQGSRNTLAGSQAASGTIGPATITDVTAVGYRAGFSNQANENVYVGSKAGFSNNAATNNTAVGFEAGEASQGDDNTYMGYHSGNSLNGGANTDRNVLVGSEAGAEINQGSDNTAVGYRALSSSFNPGSSASRITAIGSQAAQESFGSSNSVFVGYQSGANNLNGVNNTAVGYQSATTISSGNNNTLMGYQAGADASSSAQNVVIGSNAVTDLNNSNQNVFVGANISSPTIITTKGTYVGEGITSTNGTGVTLIGNSTASGNLNNASAIGYQSTVQQDNSLVLGSIAGVNGAVNNTDVGIGTTTPAQALHISGITRSARLGGVATGGSFITTPSATTDKIMFADANGDLRAMTGGSTGNVLTYTASGPAWGNASSGWGLTGNSGINSSINFMGTTDLKSVRFRSNNVERMVLDSLGNVGIGTTTPTTNIHLYHSGSSNTPIMAQLVSNASSGAPTGFYAQATSLGTATILYGGYFQTLNTSLAATNNALAAFNISTGTTNVGLRAWTIGSAPGGTNYGVYAYAQNGSVNNWAGYFGQGSGTGKVFIQDTLAINTTTPSRRFHLSGTTSGMRYGGVATGGSFITTPTATTDKIMYADANGDLRAMGAGATGEVLTMTAAGPDWGSASGTAWDLTGNSGTSSNVNFLGTTDNHPLVFRVNNNRSGYIDSSSIRAWTYFGLATGNMNLATGSNNTGFGNQVLDVVTTGGNNTAMGANAMGSLTTGVSNVAIGGSAIQQSTDGNRNTAVGSSALSITSGDDNVAIGEEAIGLVGTSNRNVAVGREAMFFNSASNDNTAVGNQAMRGATTASENVAVGSGALVGSSNTGNQNVAIGRQAINANTTGSTNVAVGYQAAIANTTGISNVAIGVKALNTNTTVSNLVAVGDSALFRNGTGVVNAIDATQNVAVGSKALFSNTLGYGNTAIGFLAARANTTASGNVAVGDSALFTNTTGSGNVAIGRNALATTNGRFGQVAVGDSALALSQPATFLPNTALGYKAMARSAGGYQNVAVGSFSGYRNTDGFENTWVGYSAGQNNTTAVSNTYIGTQSGQSTNTGSSNAGVGNQSLFNNTSGYGNVAAGHSAGLSNVTGYRNTLVGDSADVLVNNLNAASAFGYFAKVSASNTIILGDTISRPQVGIGVTAVGTTLAGTRFEIASEGVNDNLLYRYSGVQAPTFNFQRSLGTLAAPSVIGSTSTLGRFDFYGYDGTNFDQAAAISAEADSTISTGVVPSKIKFFTQNVTGGIQERVRITRNGNVVIADATDRDTKLYVDGGVTIEPQSVAVALTADNQLINVGDESYIRLSSNTVTGTLRTIYLSSGNELGQILIISSSSTGTNQFELVDVDTDASTNTETGSISLLMDPKDTATFIWDGTDWLMLAFRSNN